MAVLWSVWQNFTTDFPFLVENMAGPCTNSDIIFNYFTFIDMFTWCDTSPSSFYQTKSSVTVTTSISLSDMFASWYQEPLSVPSNHLYSCTAFFLFTRLIHLLLWRQASHNLDVQWKEDLWSEAILWRRFFWCGIFRARWGSGSFPAGSWSEAPVAVGTLHLLALRGSMGPVPPPPLPSNAHRPAVSPQLIQPRSELLSSLLTVHGAEPWNELELVLNWYMAVWKQLKHSHFSLQSERLIFVMHIRNKKKTINKIQAYSMRLNVCTVIRYLAAIAV